MKRSNNEERTNASFTELRQTIIPAPEEKQDVLNKLTAAMEEKNSEPQRQTTSRPMMKYYGALASVAVLLFLLFIPSWYPLDPSQNEEETEGVTVRSLTNGSDLKSAHLYWLETDSPDIRMPLDLEEEGISTLWSTLERVELTEVPSNPLTYQEDNRMILEVEYTVSPFTATQFTFIGHEQLYITHMEMNEITYFIATDPNKFEEMTLAAQLLSEEKERKATVDEYLRETCGWQDTKERTYFFLIDLKQEGPIPCIQPILEEPSVISIMNHHSFEYMESPADNSDYGLTTVVLPKNNGISAGTKRNIFIETEEYTIYDAVSGSDYGEREDIVIVAEGNLDEELDFFISFYDREDRYTDEEIIFLMEHELIPVLKE